MSKASPAFQFYASDWLLDSDVNCLPLAGRGLYIALLCLCWRDGSIPDDVAKITALVANTTPKEVRALWPAVRVRFVPADVQGRLVQARLELVRAEQISFKERLSAAGKRGGRHSRDVADDKASPKPGLSQVEASTAQASLEPGLSEVEASDAKGSLEPGLSSRTYTRTEASLAEGTNVPSAGAASAPGGVSPTQTRIVLPEETRARSILALIWPLVEPHIGRALTKTEWGKRNKASALDLARLERTDEDIVAAFDAARARLGEVPRMLKVVQGELAALDSGRSRQPRKRFEGENTGRKWDDETLLRGTA